MNLKTDSIQVRPGDFQGWSGVLAPGRAGAKNACVNPDFMHYFINRELVTGGAYVRARSESRSDSDCLMSCQFVK
jgi:hypothetical protein